MGTTIISSPRPAILDVRVVGDYIVTANFGPHLCVWQKKALQDKTSAGNGMPGYKLDLKYEQDFYIDQSQIVFIEEMGVRDMEGMTVTRADFWALCKENFERGDKDEEEDRDEDYSYREDEEFVDEREELFEEEGDMWREDEEQDYHCHDGDGFV